MIKSEIEELLKPIISDLGYELWGCEYLIQRKRALLRIYIDKAHGAISIEDCEKVSKQVNAILDLEDPIGGNYYLEVSSPGIPRTLFSKEQYKRYIGNQVRLTLIRSQDGSRHLSGTITSVNEHGLVLKVGEEQKIVQFIQIAKAKLIGE